MKNGYSFTNDGKTGYLVLDSAYALAFDLNTEEKVLLKSLVKIQDLPKKGVELKFNKKPITMTKEVINSEIFQNGLEEKLLQALSRNGYRMKE